MKQNNKRRMSAVLCLILAMALAACSGSGAGGGGASSSAQGGQSGANATGQTATINKDMIFREEIITLDDAKYRMEDLQRFQYIDGEIYASGMSYQGGAPADAPAQEEAAQGEAAEGEEQPLEERTEDTEILTYSATQTFFMAHFSPDGGNVQTTVLEEKVPEGTWYNASCFDNEHSLYVVKNVTPTGGGNYEAFTQMMMSSGGGTTVQMQAAGPAEEEPLEELPPPAEETVEETEEAGDEADTETETEAGGGPAAPEDTIYGGGSGMEEYYLVKYDAEGTKVFEQKLEKPENADWFNVSSLVHVEGLGVLTSDNTGIRLYSDEDGTLVKTVYETDQWPDLYTNGAGEVFLLGYEQDGMYIRQIDPKSGEIGEGQRLSDAMWMFDIYSLKPGIGSDFLLSNDSGIFTWNIGEERPTQILSYIDSDLNLDYVWQFIQIAEDELLVFYWREQDDGSSSLVCSRLTKVPPEEVVERKVITMGVTGLGSDMRRMIVNFNQQSTEYRITVIDYSIYDSEEDWMGGINRLNQDIIAGTAPDILILSYGAQLASLASKGVLEPLDEYFASDPEISAGSYMENVFDAYRYDGKMYLVIPTFSARSFAISARNAAEIETWNFETMNRMIEERGIKYSEVFGYPMTNAEFVQFTLSMDTQTYIDMTEQRAMFDSPQFINLLNLAAKFPSQEQVPSNWWEDGDVETYFRDGRALLSMAYYDSYEEYANTRYATFGEEITFIGFPREDGSGGNTVMANTQIAMNSATQDKEACWQFMRTFLTEEYQSRFVEGYGLPVSRTQLEEKARRAMERPHYTDPVTGETEYWDNTYYVNGEEIIIPPLSQEDVDLCMELFTSLNMRFEYDQTILNMVMEEIAPFFQGQKSAEEVARIIQSKVQLYLDENS